MGRPTVSSNLTLSAITDTVIDTIVSVAVSAFLCLFYGNTGNFRTLQRYYIEQLHDVVVLLGIGVTE